MNKRGKSNKNKELLKTYLSAINAQSSNITDNDTRSSASTNPVNRSR